MSKAFEISYIFVNWTDISIGVSVDLKAPRLEIHIPFGFVAIGWRQRSGRPINWRQLTNFHYLIGKPWSD